MKVKVQMVIEKEIDLDLAELFEDGEYSDHFNENGEIIDEDELLEAVEDNWQYNDEAITDLVDTSGYTHSVSIKKLK